MSRPLMGTLSVCVLLTAVAEDHHLNSNFSPWTVLLIDHLFEKVDYPFEDSVLCDTSIKLGEKTFWEIKIKKFSKQITPELLYFSQDWLAAPLLPPPLGFMPMWFNTQAIILCMTPITLCMTVYINWVLARGLLAVTNAFFQFCLING